MSSLSLVSLALAVGTVSAPRRPRVGSIFWLRFPSSSMLPSASCPKAAVGRRTHRPEMFVWETLTLAFNCHRPAPCIDHLRRSIGCLARTGRQILFGAAALGEQTLDLTTTTAIAQCAALSCPCQKLHGRPSGPGFSVLRRLDTVYCSVCGIAPESGRYDLSSQRWLTPGQTLGPPNLAGWLCHCGQCVRVCVDHDPKAPGASWPAALTTRMALKGSKRKAVLRSALETRCEGRPGLCCRTWHSRLDHEQCLQRAVCWHQAIFSSFSLLERAPDSLGC
jgi:hypothetical protein